MEVGLQNTPYRCHPLHITPTPLIWHLSRWMPQEVLEDCFVAQNITLYRSNGPMHHMEVLADCFVAQNKTLYRSLKQHLDIIHTYVHDKNRNFIQIDQISQWG